MRTAAQAPPAAPRRLRREELPADTVALARFLIGRMLVHDLPEGRAVLRIVETEAYPAGDPASHAWRGETRRNRSMYLGPGYAYVYIAYGMYPCVNVTSEDAGIGAAVLVRAGEPVEGIGVMQRLRAAWRGAAPARLAERDLARGPGRLAVALGIGLGQDGTDLCGQAPLWLGTPLAGAPAAGEIGASPRIGITRAADAMLRFFEAGSPCLSGTARLNRRAFLPLTQP